MEQKKNLCAQIPLSLHTQVSEAREAADQTTSEYITNLLIEYYNARRTISSVKRHMGTNWRTDIDGKRYTPQEISAMVLRKLREDAEAYLGGPVTDAVILDFQ